MNSSAQVETSAQSSALESEDEKISMQLSLFPEIREPEKVFENFGTLKQSENERSRFVFYYFVSGNAVQSALNAGLATKYGSAKSIGSKLLTCLDIQAALKVLKEKATEENVVKALDVIKDIIANREHARNPGDGKRPDFRAVNECNRQLGQILNMFGPESVNNNVVTIGSFAELKKVAESLKKEGESENLSEDKKDDWKETV